MCAQARGPRSDSTAMLRGVRITLQLLSILIQSSLCKDNAQNKELYELAGNMTIRAADVVHLVG